MTKGKGKTPGFGGLDKHLKRDAHKERGQLPHRKRLGQLEKHKDYVKRAKRRHEKDAKLLQLKRAAAHRNPDEFNIKMTERVLDPATGKMKKRRRTTAEAERKKELVENRKSQQYLAHKEYTDRQKIVSLLDDVVGLDAAPQNTHTVFVDDDEDVVRFNAAKHFNTTNEMLRTPATRINLAKVAHEAPDLDRREQDDYAALDRARALGSSSAADDGNNGDEADAAPQSFAERLRAARMQVAKERRRAENEERRQAATKMREVAERRRRHVQLHEMNSTLRRRTGKIEAKQRKKEQAKYAPGASVRKR